MAWQPPDPGEMREVVGLESAPIHADKPDAYNAQEPAWTSLGTRRAKVSQLSGREFWFAQQSNSAISVKVTLRYVDTLASTRFRLTWRNMVLNVSAVINPDNQKVWMELMCQSKAQPAQARG